MLKKIMVKQKTKKGPMTSEKPNVIKTSLILRNSRILYLSGRPIFTYMCEVKQS